MNSLWITPVVLSLIAGSSIFLGAYLASKENIHRKWLESELHHGITALGGGISRMNLNRYFLDFGMIGYQLTRGY